MRKLFTIIYLLLFSISINAQCFIEALVVEAHECDSLDQYLVDIDFNTIGGTDSFELDRNGILYGVYAYEELYITVGPFDSNCDLESEFVVRDQDFSDCTATAILEPICCTEENCEIGELDIDLSDCNDLDQFFVTINFEYANVESDSFTVVGNGMNHGTFGYNELPIEIGPLNGNCDINYEAVVFDTENDGCASDAEIGVICCTGECVISGLVVETTDCNDAGFFNVVIDFDFENEVAATFEVAGNGNNYGTFMYSALPITIEGLEGDCETEYEFVVFDAEQESCSAATDIGEICCNSTECFIGEIDYVIECTNDTLFTLYMNFEYENVSDSFTIVGNGSNYGTFSYSNLPLTLAELGANCDLDREFIILDSDDESCNSVIEAGIICCVDECFIGELDIAISDCDEEDQFNIVVNFEYNNTASNSFVLAGNGNNYGTFLYTDLPVTLEGFEGDCETNYELVAFDSEEESCNSDIEIGEICCNPTDCDIYEMDYIVECVNDTLFDIQINFDYVNVSDSFSIVGNGNNYGTFSYENLPITLTNLGANCELDSEFVVVDSEEESCNNFVGPGIICCEEECTITELDIVISDCNDADQFNITLNFEYLNPASNSFVVAGNGSNYGTFLYTDLPIVLEGFDGDCETEYELVVFDSEQESCYQDIELGEVCCNSTECDISELEYVIECVNDTLFDILINFEYVNVSDSFTIVGNGNNYGTFSYDNLPVTLANLGANCELDREFVVFDSEEESCNSVIEAGVICCEEECTITELEIVISDCNDADQFNVTVNFEYLNPASSSFVIAGNGNNYGTFLYTDLPITLEGFDADCETEYEFVVFDSEEESCNQDIEIGVICCNIPDCYIDELDLVLECDPDGAHTLIVNFDFEATSDNYDLFINGENWGQYPYSELPLNLTFLEPDCEVNYEILIVDSEQEDCYLEESVFLCCSEECVISELDVEVSECYGEDLFSVTINFDYVNAPSNSFTVLGNGNNYGTFAYDDLPIEIEDLEADCETNYEFIVVDSEQDGCSSEVSLAEICCEVNDCSISELVVELDCTGDSTFIAVINFDYVATSSSFTIMGNGNDYGTFAYADLPISLEGLQADCETNYEFVVRDVEFQDCAEDIGIGEVCCNEMECEIGELDIDVICFEGEFVNVQLDFDYAGTSTSFTVGGNGNFYGTFDYADLPVVLEEFGYDCEMDFEFVVIDSEMQDCASDIDYGIICCEEEACNINITGVPMLDCIDGEVFMTVDFSYEGVSGVGYDAWIDGEYFGFFDYSMVPLVVEGYESDNTEATIDLTICENDSEECCDEFTVANPCFGVGDHEFDLTDIYWNYYNGSGTLMNNMQDDLEYAIYSIDGKRLEYGKVGAFAQKEIFLTDFTHGMYVLQVSSDQKLKMWKMIH